MKRILFPLAIVAALVFSSCATSKFYSQDASSVRPLALVQPCSYLTDAVGDFSTVYYEPVSKANNDILMETIPTMGLPIEKVVPFEFNCADKSDATVRWMRRLGDVNMSGAKEMKVPAEILDAVKASGCRYGMVLSDIGYVKNARQYNIEKAIETGVKIADAIVLAGADGHLGTTVTVEVGNGKARRVAKNNTRSTLDAPEQRAVQFIGIPDNCPKTVLLRVTSTRAVTHDIATGILYAL